MSLQTDLTEARRAILAEMTAKRKAIIVGVGEAIIDDTPVRTGALKGSWQTTLGAPAATDGLRLDPEGEAPKQELANAKVDLEADVYLTNNLNYAERIEFGYSPKAPAGMVRVNIAGVSDVTLTLGAE